MSNNKCNVMPESTLKENKTTLFQWLTLSGAAIICLILLVLQNQQLLEFAAHPNDGYMEAFKKFYSLGFYNGNVKGFSMSYNGVISFFYFFTGSISFSFFLTNIISQIIIVFIAVKLINRFKIKIKRYWFLCLLLFIMFQLLNLKSYAASSDDTFLGVFVISIIYFVFEDNGEKLFGVKKSFLIGLFLAIALSIRPTAVVLIFSFLIAYLYLGKILKISLKTLFRSLAIWVGTFVIFTGLFHFPSLKEQNKLAVYDKNPPTGANWTQRNYLGLKKIQAGEAKIHRDAIWKDCKFNVVNDYLDINGKDSLPDSFLKVLLKDPILLLLISLYNFVFCFLWELRFYGFLPFVPLFFVISKSFQSIYKVSFVFLLTVFITFSTVCITFIEMRWLIGYEILIPVSIICSLGNLAKIIGEKKVDAVITLSIIIVTVLNFKTLLSTL
ncbi:hypothetical protein GV828_06465 [Flavobacterium sp. NST-5]|uniref:Glycosyltransferase RgtA/B/C/D-like domain-containing protein n=1 Tax=Flavobacterium ichthyis TaxID=2698827 RepID=A0ABW9ZC05_9FLAO|nr:hypothetical protein [Flavobacterium ichthyis]NBL64842.1 hypothetical protein [Flavobacterium ichthyis]